MGVTLDSAWAGQLFAPPTPLDIATIESAIAAQLRAQVSAIEIAQFPDKPAAYRLTHRIGAALVAWRGATYGALIDTAAVVQARRLEFEVTLLVRDLGWSFGGDPSGPNPGAYALLEAIRAALTGLRLPGCRKMFPLREQFLGRDPQGGGMDLVGALRARDDGAGGLDAGQLPALHQRHRAGGRRTNRQSRHARPRSRSTRRI